jgi:hypothetical protein
MAVVVKIKSYNMKANFIIITLLVLLFSSCNKQKNENSKTEISSTTEVENIESLKLFQQKCYTCHSIITKSHDEIIAPPMAAVKRRYMKEYDSKDDFVKAVVAYASDPKAENALMIGAVDKFKAMPKQAFTKDDLTKIATYIYDNEIETPEWFEDHFQQNHKNRQGMGRGKNK